MAATGVLPFIRGIDFSHYDFSSDSFPNAVEQMSGLRWMKLCRTNLDRVPNELSQLKNLEHLQMNRNNLTSLHGELSDLPCLRSVIARDNQIKTSGIPTDIFNMQDLTIIDFRHNALKDIPPNLDRARWAVVLNLSHNNIEMIPNQLFVNMDDLLYLDLSHNKLEMLPPQIRRLVELKVLVLNDNPLQHFQLKQLPSMTQLRVLHMRNTQRNTTNIPSIFDNLINLEDVDFSQNDLKDVPEALFKLKNLRRLNLSDNLIDKLPNFQSSDYLYSGWPELENLNFSRNNLKQLPNDLLQKWSKLRKLLLNNNLLTFDGIPANCSKLINLEIFHAAYNNLELIPEGLARCPKLKKVKLNNNRLITVPDTLYLLSDLQELDLRNNPDLVMPPKPSELRKARLAFYNIDFSLENQMRLAGNAQAAALAGSTSSLGSSSPLPNVGKEKDPVARKIRMLRTRKGQAVAAAAAAGGAHEADNDQQKILTGLTEVAKERTRAEQALEESRRNSRLASKRWDEALEKPPVDYSDLFDPDVGQIPGITVWEIENFLPNLLDEVFHGKFYEGDCYIVLKTYLDQANNLNWQIYYWIGERATLDKKACSAIHAVNLRNFLGASCRTIREEMNEESDEFLDLFNGELVYVSGGRTSSGFYNLEEFDYPARLYRVTTEGPGLHLEAVSVNVESLDPRFVFFMDAGKKLLVWFGKKAGGVVKTKTRLFAEKVNKTERKGEAEIIVLSQDKESQEFWGLIGISPEGGSDVRKPEDPIVEHVPSDFKSHRCVLFNVKLGTGFLELPQIDSKRGQLKQTMLDSRCVYILDCYSNIFIWIGEKSTRLVKAAGIKCAAELQVMIDRPDFTAVNRIFEGSETMIFKSKFVGWDDVMAVDFTRTAESVQRRGANIKVILERDKMKTELAALFVDRQPIIPEEEADQMIIECNEDLEFMEPFVLEGKKFVRLPDDEFGIFYTQDCYVFLCRYWVPSEDFDDQDDEKGKSNEKLDSLEGTGENGKPAALNSGSNLSADVNNPQNDDFQCVVYFWQGRDAGNMGWLTFTFSLQKKFESLFKDKLEVVRMYQQQENQKFLSHFKKRCIIKRGRRNLTLLPGAVAYPAMFQMRANGSAVCTRMIQIENKADNLNSEFCYIVKYPLRIRDEQENNGYLYVWLGSKSKTCEQTLIEQLARENLNVESFPVVLVKENEEPDQFWDALTGGKSRNYDNQADFMRHTRLFRCTNEKGYFVVAEKTIDFCQDDLDDDDVMILDNGDQVFLWCGVRASEVEVKLAYKAAQVYIQNLRLKQPNRPRKLCVTLKGKESKRFTKCFHAWSKHKVPAGD